MEWKNSDEELPPLNECTRCLAFCLVETKGEDFGWSCYVDVYFDPFYGWRRCEDERPIKVLKWVHIDGIHFRIESEE